MKLKLSLLSRIFIAVYIGVSLLALSGLFTGLERTLLDARFRLRGPEAVNPAIVHVDIDADALKAEGSWNAWTATRHATVINILKRLGIRAFGMDIFFTERVNARSACANWRPRGGPDSRWPNWKKCSRTAWPFSPRP